VASRDVNGVSIYDIDTEMGFKRETFPSPIARVHCSRSLGPRSDGVGSRNQFEVLSFGYVDNGIVTDKVVIPTWNVRFLTIPLREYQVK
jgi:hypothetical protein